MAILIDKRARDEITRRESRGRPVAVNVHIARLRHGTHVLLAEWTGSHGRGANQEETRVGDVRIFVDERLARYARWRDVTISAQNIGPLHYLIVVDELPVLLDMAGWERSHPGVGRAAEGAGVPARLIA
jgi:hypothetical protein